MTNETIRKAFIKIERAAVEAAINQAALTKLLIDKGIITEKEFLDERARASQVMDQEQSRRREQAIADFQKLKKIFNPQGGGHDAAR